MEIKKLFSKNQRIIYQKKIDGCMLLVKENDQYRWFEYAGDSVQSLMNKKVPEQPIMPVYQALLMFLLLQRSALNVLNLGLGGASIDRALAPLSDIGLTSVDASQEIIDVAKSYFKLPDKVVSICQKAEDFIYQTEDLYDVVLCDLFIGEKNPDFLFEQDFYDQLTKITTCNAVIMINLQVDNNAQLLQMLQMLRKLFPYLALIEFADYSNIVIMCSSLEIPSKTVLQHRLENFTGVTFTCLNKAIEKMHYIPHCVA